MSKERDILKSLLLKEELQLLNQLEQKLLSKEQFTKEVSDVLSNAIKRAQSKNKNLEKELYIPIRKGVTKAFVENKQSIIDALLPIMGQLIRKTVTNSIKQFVTDINRTLELGFSAKAIKWRWQALRSDCTFAEILFQKTIRYQVTELFLIRQTNGLLIEHAGHSETAKDNSAVSAMLTAIQGFIEDSFNEHDSALQRVTIKNKDYIVTSGPTAYLAAVIKGAPTQRLETKLQQAIENIHAEFSDQINTESNYGENIEIQDSLRKYLITKNRSDKPKKINWTPWIIITLLIISGFSYWSYGIKQELKRIVDLSHSVPGLYVQSVKRIGSGYRIKGLLDPLAEITSLHKDNITLDTKPYLSLDEDIVLKRVMKLFSPYKKVTIKLTNGKLTINGIISSDDDILKVLHQLESIGGIKQIINNLAIDQQKQMHAFLLQNKLKNQVNYLLNNNKLSLIGNMKYKQQQELTRKFTSLFPEIIIDAEKTNIIDSTDKIVYKINNLFINIKELNDPVNNYETLDKLIDNLHLLINRQERLHIRLVGKSDCNGLFSDNHSLKRAETLFMILAKKGIDKKLMTTHINACKSFNNPHNQSLLGVSIQSVKE